METPRTRAMIRIYGYQWSECGYCKGQRASLVDRQPNECSRALHILVSSTGYLTAAQYELFVNQGWRRCGVTLYKPDNWVSCCPQFTIRLPVPKFVPTKSQKKVWRKMETAISCLPAPSDNKSVHSHAKKSKTIASATPATTNVPVHAQARLAQYVETALREIMTTLAHTQQQCTATTTDDATDAASHRLPDIVFKERHPVGKSKGIPESNNHNSDPTVILTTAVCAAIAGKSNGAIDRATLSAKVVTHLQQMMERVQSCDSTVEHDNNCPSNIQNYTDYRNHNHTNQQTPSAKRSRMEVEEEIIKVEAHAKSGQIIFHVRMGKEAASTEAIPMDGVDTTTNLQSDRLAQWWARRVLRVQRRAADAIGSTFVPLSNKRHLTVTTMAAHQSALDPEVYRLYALYQQEIHNDPDPFLQDLMPNMDETLICSSSSSSILPLDPWEDNDWGQRAPKGWKAKLRQALERDFQSLPKERQSHLIQHYIQFYDFLVDNPYPSSSENNNSNNNKCWSNTSINAPSPSITTAGVPYGTFHQQYLVNGVLIAVGVVDILPGGLSSVYSFYDPDFCQNVAPLGKYTVLREIEWARDHGLPYYYLGYYIESCPKMRYKADYAPSELLCPRTATWVAVEHAQRVIQEHSPLRHCCAFVGDHETGAATDKNVMDPHPLTIPAQLQLEVGFGRYLSWQELPSEAQNVLEPHVRDFCREAGTDLGQQIVMDFR